jgi:hypothetical protein
MSSQASSPANSFMISKSEPSIVIPFLGKSISVQTIRDLLCLFGEIKDIRMIEGKTAGKPNNYVDAIIDYESWFPSSKNTRMQLLHGNIITLNEVLMNTGSSAVAIKAQKKYAKDSHFVFEFSPCNTAKKIAPTLSSIRPANIPALVPTVVTTRTSRNMTSIQDARQSRNKHTEYIPIAEKTHIVEENEKKRITEERQRDTEKKRSDKQQSYKKVTAEERRIAEEKHKKEKENKYIESLPTDERIRYVLRNRTAYVEVDYSECGSIPPKCKKLIK